MCVKENHFIVRLMLMRNFYFERVPFCIIYCKFYWKRCNPCVIYRHSLCNRNIIAYNILCFLCCFYALWWNN